MGFDLSPAQYTPKAHQHSASVGDGGTLTGATMVELNLLKSLILMSMDASAGG